MQKVLLVPLLTVAVLLTATALAVPALEKTSADEKTQEVQPSLQYDTVSYQSFSELQDENYVGEIQCKAVGLSVPVVYNAAMTGTVSMAKGATEPWKNGCVVLYGNNVKAQFRALHGAQAGDTFEIAFYENGTYTYRLKSIAYIRMEKEIDTMKKSGTLLLCLRYNDFANLDQSYLYTVYTAEEV